MQNSFNISTSNENVIKLESNTVYCLYFHQGFYSTLVEVDACIVWTVEVYFLDLAQVITVYAFN